jgi:phosphatidylglycerol---prolipoprotein diacylglyceryl transferase
VPWHFVFESLAYVAAFRVYLQERSRNGDFLAEDQRWSVVVAAILGAAIGSRFLFLFEDPFRTVAHRTDFAYLLSGKTILGALLGGTCAVELTKRFLGIDRRTGDLFAIPLALGIAIGRIGCLLAGKSDDTYGLPTSLPWAIDLGDDIGRHPVQIYEILAMLLLIALLKQVHPPRFAEGDRFRVFLFTYCLWRVAVDSLKPGVALHGLTALQWAALAAVIWYAKDILQILMRFHSFQKAAVHG